MLRFAAAVACCLGLAGCALPVIDNPAYYDDPEAAWAQDPYLNDPFWSARPAWRGYGLPPPGYYGHRPPRWGWAGPGPGPGWPDSPRRDRNRGRLTIDGAVYQSENGIAVDASRYVRKECEGERDCDVKAKNKIFGDPDVGAHKELIVKYRCGNGPQRTLIVPEKREMDIDCD
jgi:hypothetical protein